jgi:hypothetical protein
MHLLRDALPDPMIMESTLSLPRSNASTAVSSDQLHMTVPDHIITWTEPHNSLPTNQMAMLGPDGESWLPAEIRSMVMTTPLCSVRTTDGKQKS